MHMMTPSLARGLTAASTVLLLAVSTGCATHPDTRFDQDPNVDLTTYKTFAFYPPLATDQAGYASLLTSRVQQAARARLERADYVYSEDNPDLRVGFALQVAERTGLRSTPAGPGLYGYRAWGAAGVETVDYRQGTLTIDLVDARRNALVWHGVAEGRLGEGALKNPGPAIDLVVGELFAGFRGGVTR